jgi:hypothetical protein
VIPEPSEVPGSTALTADAVAAAVGTVSVVRMHDGSTAATYLPGRRVPGVRIDGQDVEVHAAVVFPTTVTEAADAIRAALRSLTPGRVDVVIDDVVVFDDTTDDTTDDTGRQPASPTARPGPVPGAEPGGSP